MKNKMEKILPAVHKPKIFHIWSFTEKSASPVVENCV